MREKERREERNCEGDKTKGIDKAEGSVRYRQNEAK